MYLRDSNERRVTENRERAKISSDQEKNKIYD